MNRLRLPRSVLAGKPAERPEGHPVCARCEEPIGNLPLAAQIDPEIVAYCSAECVKPHPMRKEAIT